MLKKISNNSKKHTVFPVNTIPLHINSNDLEYTLERQWSHIVIKYRAVGDCNCLKISTIQ